MSIKIAFHTDFFDVRGTCVSLYDYAHYNETILKNKSIILVPRKGLEDNQKSDQIAINKFANRFEIYPYENINHMESILEFQKCDILYMIKYGKNDGMGSQRVKTVVHCVFDMSEPTPFNSVEVPVIADDTHDAKEYAITFAENNIKPEVYGQYYEANTIQTLSEYEGLKTKKRITPSIDLP